MSIAAKIQLGPRTKDLAKVLNAGEIAVLEFTVNPGASG